MPEPRALPARLAVVDELPRTPSLKVDRPAVRALFAGDPERLPEHLPEHLPERRMEWT